MSEGDVFAGLVKVSRLGPQGMVTLRGDLSSAALKGAVQEVAGVDLPDLRAVRSAPQRAALWMSPDELLLLLPHAQVRRAVETLGNALAGEHALAVDVSDARAMFELQGGAVREVIAKLAPVDMAPARFGPGEVRRTHFAQVAAAFWMSDQSTARVICFRSVADYMHQLLRTAADPDAPVGLWTK